MRKYKVGLAIPTYNAGGQLKALLPAIESQSLKVDHFQVVDSSSPDNSAQILGEFGAGVHVIPQTEFDHGGTRQWMVEHMSDCDIIIFLTQDAIPANSHCFETIIQAFDDMNVVMAYGRQLPRREAGPIETHARLVNYTAKAQIVNNGNANDMGLKAVFCSNSFAAYRRDALMALGGFPKGTIFAEDVIVAAKALMAGWSKAYVPEAQVYHSHQYGLVQDFRRNFDIGVFHQKEKWIIDRFGRAEGDGIKFVASELSYLSSRAPYLIPSALTRSIGKYVAYRLGRGYKRRSSWWNRLFSMSQSYWI